MSQTFGLARRDAMTDNTPDDMNYANSIHEVAQTALIALSMARVAGKAKSRLATNRFLVDWAIRVLKQRVFADSVQRELVTIANMSQQRMFTAKLESAFEKILAEHAQVTQLIGSFPQSYRQRLDNAMSALREIGWEATAGLARDWDNAGPYDVDYPAVFIPDTHMLNIDEQGQITAPVGVFVQHGDPQQLIDTFYRCGLLLYLSQASVRGQAYYLHPDNQSLSKRAALVSEAGTKPGAENKPEAV